MNSKTGKIAALTAGHEGGGLDARYVAFFACFNRQQFFEAHEVLEALWLPDRQGPNGSFYKGLIQLAGAFVHLQKDRLRPAAALLKLTRANLVTYPSPHEHLEVATVVGLADAWLARLESAGFGSNPLHTTPTPTLRLLGVGGETSFAAKAEAHPAVDADGRR